MCLIFGRTSRFSELTARVYYFRGVEVIKTRKDTHEAVEEGHLP